MAASSPSSSSTKTALLASTRDFRKRIYHTLPLHYRIARVFMVLSSDSALAFAKGVFGLFLLRGVEGMPPVDPDSSLGKALARGDKNLAKYMPSGWAAAELLKFKANILYVLGKKTKNPAMMQDIMSDAFENLIKSDAWKRIDPSRGLKGAIAYVLTVISRAAIDRWKKNKEDEASDSLTVTDDDGNETERVVPDLSISDVGRMIDVRRVLDLLEDPDVQSDLKNVHPDALLFIRLLMDGFTQKEILGDPPRGVPSMLPHWKFGPSAWQPKPDRGYGPNILRVLRNHALDQEHAAPSHFHFLKK